ncbi:iron uptake transporter deferrochelatase/peroxidase subunit [Micromonospora polyrhachis]|uniref:Deferrochelatase/peroxidase EfeB n=1 Tax=Micromonospora polyrhachis TaxID=1282883 RepID=A0A7W7WRA5_9ACTN|nr:Dyp-type peroxidase [Micromonospora polyrhachis]MBB4960875.1 deferrochelatase/peroxidase EfeB [Micromonospora polyrhachis]
MTDRDTVSRRAFLAAAGAVGLTGATACGGSGTDGSAAGKPSVTASPTEPVRPAQVARVARQEAVEAPAPGATLLVAYDVEATDRAGLTAALRAVSARVAGAAATVAVGASLFDQRYGLRAPRLLTPMPAFRADVLDPDWCHGDLLVQISADDPEALAVRLGRPIPGLRQRWHIEGFHPPGGSGVRNLFGFREGVGNPDPTDRELLDRLVWVQPGDDEPAWCVGGTYQVVRLIRLAMPTWDAEPAAVHERVFGRSKETGAPLGRSHETDEPDFAADPDGRVIPLDAHIRRANPRTPESERHRILRRGYSYRRTPTVAGTQDVGHIFICFQRDVERGFATIQRRLSGEALERYTLPFGGGYYFVLPASTGADDYLGRTMLHS